MVVILNQCFKDLAAKLTSFATLCNCIFDCLLSACYFTIRSKLAVSKMSLTENEKLLVGTTWKKLSELGLENVGLHIFVT